MVVKGYIYAIVCNITGETYYGCTGSKIKRRLYEHENAAKHDRGCCSKQIINRGNYTLHLVEECSYYDMHEIETEYIQSYECINIHKKLTGIPLRT